MLLGGEEQRGTSRNHPTREQRQLATVAACPNNLPWLTRNIPASYPHPQADSSGDAIQAAVPGAGLAAMISVEWKELKPPVLTQKYLAGYLGAIKSKLPSGATVGVRRQGGGLKPHLCCRSSSLPACAVCKCWGVCPVPASQPACLSACLLACLTACQLG